MSDRVGSLVVAVPGTPDPLATGLPALRYPLADADGFRDYVRKAWPKSPPGLHVRLPSGDAPASLAAVRGAVARLGSAGPFDLFFLYLTGHGARALPDGAWFCTAGLAAGERGIDAAELDRLLAMVPARDTLLFLDCCHAASIVQGTSFFTALPSPAQARLYVCSSQGGQLTWEDDADGHGLFTAVLLEALRTGSPARSGQGPLATVTSVDVDGELFPYLCREVPLVVLRRKNQAQEPVKGGIARWPVRLPVGDALGAEGERPVLVAVLHQLRRIAAAVAFGLVAAVLFIEFFLYYLAVDAEGQLAVKRGVRPLAWLVPGQAGTRVQTDFSQNDLDEGTGEVGSLLGGSNAGVWRHLSASGYRRWLDDIAPALKKPIRSRTTFEVTGELPREVLAGAPGYFQGWRAKLVADSLLTAPAEPADRVAQLEGWVPRLSAVDPQTGIIEGTALDFTVLKLSTAEVVRLQAAMAVWATADPETVFRAFPDLVRAVCYRAAHGLPEEDALAEARGLADVLRSVGAARAVSGAPLGPADRKLLLEEAGRLGRYKPGLRAWVLSAMAGLGSPADQQQTQAELLKVLGTFDPDNQGSLLRLDQAVALDALGRSAANHPLPPEVFAKLLALTQGFQERLLGVPDFAQLLLRVAPHQPLPDDVRDMLWRFVRSAPAPPLDSSRVFALRVLAAGAGHLPPPEQTAVVAAASETLVPSAGRVQVLAETYGWLGAHGLATDQMIQSLNEALVPGQRRTAQTPAQDEDEDIPALAVEGFSDVPAGLALGKVLQNRAVPDPIADRLYQWAVERRALHTQNDLVAGLAAQRGRTSQGKVSAASIRSGISGSPRKASVRSIEVQIAIYQLLAVPRPERVEALGALWGLYHSEQEVEVRQALHRVWLGTRRAMDLKDAGFR